MVKRRRIEPETPSFFGGFVILARLLGRWLRRAGPAMFKGLARFENPHVAAWRESPPEPVHQVAAPPRPDGKVTTIDTRVSDRAGVGPEREDSNASRS